MLRVDRADRRRASLLDLKEEEEDRLIRHHLNLQRMFQFIHLRDLSKPAAANCLDSILMQSEF